MEESQKEISGKVCVVIEDGAVVEREVLAAV